MDCPKDIKKKSSQLLWKRLFNGLRPKSEIHTEMAKRYLYWLEYYHSERQEVEKKGTVEHNRNGVPKTSTHYSNMATAEDQMRRLYERLLKDKCLSDPQDENEGLGEFATL